MNGERWAARDLRAVAEAIVDLLEERGLVAGSTSPTRVLDAAEVARLLGRERQWVYDHAGELGAFRFGDGPKARIGFDLFEVERWKRNRQIRQTAPAAQPRRRGRSRKPGAPTAVNLIPYDPSPYRA